MSTTVEANGEGGASTNHVHCVIVKRTQRQRLQSQAGIDSARGHGAGEQGRHHTVVLLTQGVTQCAADGVHITQEVGGGMQRMLDRRQTLGGGAQRLQHDRVMRSRSGAVGRRSGRQKR
jgi:hypothetical protein